MYILSFKEEERMKDCREEELFDTTHNMHD